MLNGKVNSYIADLIRSGAISSADASAISSASSSQGLSSLSSIDALPPDVQNAVREAFRQGSRFAFVSLIPWAGLAFIASLFLTRIDGDQARREHEERAVKMGELTSTEEPKVGSASNTPKVDASSPNLVAVAYKSKV